MQTTPLQTDIPLARAGHDFALVVILEEITGGVNAICTYNSIVHQTDE